MQRRAFLLAGAGWTAANALAADDQRSLAIVDTHTHFYDPTRPQGVAGQGRQGALPPRPARRVQAVGPAARRRRHGRRRGQSVGRGQRLAARPGGGDPFLLGVVGRLDPAADTFDAHLRPVRPQSALPRHPHRPRRPASRAGGQAGQALPAVDRPRPDGGRQRRTGPAGRRRPPGRPVAEAADRRQPCGEPEDRRPAGAAAAGATGCATARHANVFCKVSALVEQTARTPPPRDVDYYRPVLDALWADFGADRLLFGSNWPVSATKAPLATVVDIVRVYFADKGERAAVRFFHDNAPVAYRYRAR
ncbi:MAG: amidohydrolase family protein [Gemmataceae bacterium]